jgi:hypothetical protein
MIWESVSYLRSIRPQKSLMERYCIDNSLRSNLILSHLISLSFSPSSSLSLFFCFVFFFSSEFRDSFVSLFLIVHMCRLCVLYEQYKFLCVLIVKTNPV